MSKETIADIPTGNKFLLLIHIKNTDVHGSKRLISPQTLQQLSKKIVREFKTKDDGEIVLLKLVDKEHKRVKTVQVRMHTKGRETITEIKDRLMSLNEIVDIPEEEKYRVVIDNCQSGKVDKRAFSMRFKGTMQDCYVCMRDFFELIVKEMKDDDIVFLQDKKEKTTHRVLIHKSGSAENYKKFHSKSFSIYAPNYSSEEIIEIVRRKLKCEKQNS